jgi:O-methyltransferase involved in polyketide biosynthesis
MQIEPISFHGAKETLLIPLYCRARDYQSPAPILNDPAAAAIVQRIEYDFGKLAISERTVFLGSVRAKEIDQMTRNFLGKHPTATVLHLACGLDSRVLRIDPPATVRWYDLDYPDVIALRERLYPTRAGCTLIGASVDDEHWLADIPADQPALIIAEGLTMYLSEDQVRRLFERVVNHFPGGELLFDAYSKTGAGMSRRDASIKATGAAIQWSIDDPYVLEQEIPRLKFIRKWSFGDATDLNRLPLGQRLMYKLIASIPSMQHAHRVLLYSF